MCPPATLHALFEHQARARPAHPAVIADGRPMSYDDLNRRANRVARRLRELGAGPGTMVGISVGRSPAMLVGLLGILKAGGAYVPLDPSYPADRLTHMLEDTQAPVIVCDHRSAAALPPHEAALLVLDGPEALDGSDHDHDRSDPGDPGDLAYVIYTSGSTGRPKGVLVTHGSVLNLVTHQNYVTITADDRVAALATLSFDASTFELWAPLVNGATCVLHEFGGSELDGLVSKACRDDVTVLHLTSPVFRLLEARHFDALAGVHTILFGGDSVRSDIGVRARESFAGRLVHLYGPTETTGFATFLDLDHLSGTTPHIPIGGPIRNVQVQVTDDAGRPVPDGETGELLIGGAGVARGYLNRPGITAERFVSDQQAQPHAGPVAAPVSGERWYRTGDLVRVTPDGAIEFLGRVDRQIKVRGYRIEPAEIETALTAHPSVRDAVVVGTQDRTGDKRLDAYLVPALPLDQAGLEWLVADVRAHVQAVLPSHQQPATLTVIDRIPLTDNLKVDQARLPAPVLGRPASGVASDGAPKGAPAGAPEGALEAELAELWCDALGLEGVQLDDNFFDLGGDSLAAVLMAAAVHRSTGRTVTVQDVIRHPTIRELSVAVRAD